MAPKWDGSRPCRYGGLEQVSVPYLYRSLLCRLYMYPRPLLGTIKGEVRERQRRATRHEPYVVEQPHSTSVHTTVVFTLVQELRCRIIQTIPPAGRRAFSCPNQDKSLCLSASPSEKGSTHTSFTRWCDPPGEKHRQLARQVGVLCVFSLISHSFPDGHSRFADSALHGDLVREPRVHVYRFWL